MQSVFPFKALNIFRGCEFGPAVKMSVLPVRAGFDPWYFACSRGKCQVSGLDVTLQQSLPCVHEALGLILY